MDRKTAPYEPHASVISGPGAIIPAPSDPYIYLNSIPVAGATKGAWDATGFHTSGYLAFVINTTLSDYYLVGSAAAPDTTVKAPILKSPVLHDDLSGADSKIYEYSAFGWAQISVPDGPRQASPEKISASLTGTSQIVEGDSAARSATYTIKLDKAAANAVTINYGTSNGLALAGEDYKSTSGSHTFAPGETAWSFAVDVLPDVKLDSPENFNVTISPGTSSSTSSVALSIAAGTVTTSISDGVLPSSASTSLSKLADIGSVTKDLIQISGSLLAADPAIASDLARINKVVGDKFTALGLAATFVEPLTQFRSEISSVANIKDPVLKNQAEWMAYRNLDVSVGDGLAKFAFVTALGVYASEVSLAYATATGIEVYLAAFAATSGFAISAPLLIGAGAAIVGGLALSEAYDRFISPTFREALSTNFEFGVPSPVSQNLPPQAKNFGSLIHDATADGGKVFALYNGLLGRAPDVGGLESWTASLKAGAAVRDIASNFLASAEGQARTGALDNAAFVKQLYQTTLHRQFDQGGLDNWLGQLSHGSSRADVATSFALSNEHIASLKTSFDAGIYVPDAAASNVARLYYAVLDRAPDTGGLINWTNYVKSGAPIEAVTQSFLSTPEVQAKTGSLSNSQYVDMTYKNALGRHAEPNGLAAWTAELDHGASRVGVTTAIGLSAEAQQYHLKHIENGWLIS